MGDGNGGEDREAGAQPLLWEELRWQCDPSQFAFGTTAQLERLDVFVGQQRAVDALRFGVGMPHEGYNLFLMGPAGTGRHELVDHVLEEAAERAGRPLDWCYVYNFEEPLRPRALGLPPGRGGALRDDMEELLEDLQATLTAAFLAEDVEDRREAILEAYRSRRDEAFEVFQGEARERDIAVMRTPGGVALAPTRDGEILPPQEAEALPPEEREALEEIIDELQSRFLELMGQAPTWDRERREGLRELHREVARGAIEPLFAGLRARYEGLLEVMEYLRAVEEDVLEHAPDFLPRNDGDGDGGGGGRKEPRPQESGGGRRGAGAPAARPPADGEPASFGRYRVNLLVDHGDDERDGAPVIYEDHPTLENLLGRIEHRARYGALTTDFRLIRPGALHRANGGYLILDARKLLMNPYSWEHLKRALFSHELRMENPFESNGAMVSTVTLEPEPVPLDVKVVLVGERHLYYALSAGDPDFSELFKVPADIEDDVVRGDDAPARYARLVGTLAADDGLLPLRPEAVSLVLERCARVTGDRHRLTAHVTYIRDMIREADFWARQREAEAIEREDVVRAVRAREVRLGRVRDRIQEQIEQGTVHVETQGARVGQVNGLAVLQIGQLTFGKPSRITATVQLGAGEVVDIEREIQLGGPLHTKGVLILQGFLGERYGQQRPLSLRAALVFEQSYGGVDGDSATMAECCALLSALAEAPIGQGFAITGSMDQAGRAQAIGGVNEKIEGFFRLCSTRGLTGRQGVIIPQTNVRHLMLHPDVVEACRRGQFHVWAVSTVDQAVALLTGQSTGERGPDGGWSSGEHQPASGCQARGLGRGRPRVPLCRTVAPGSRARRGRLTPGRTRAV